MSDFTDRPEYSTLCVDINKQLAILDTITDANVLDDLHSMIERREWMRAPGLYFPKPYCKDESRVVARRSEIQPSWFNQPLVMKESEIVNGYALYDTDDPLMFYNVFESLLPTFTEKEDPPMSLETFLELYEDEACTEWSKMTDHGECFGGFWDYPEDSIEYENKWNLTRNYNGRKLYQLPFPKRFLIETMKIGCNNRMESVRYSNFIGVWMQRKVAQKCT